MACATALHIYRRREENDRAESGRCDASLRGGARACISDLVSSALARSFHGARAQCYAEGELVLDAHGLHFAPRPLAETRIQHGFDTLQARQSLAVVEQGVQLVQTEAPDLLQHIERKRLDSLHSAVWWLYFLVMQSFTTHSANTFRYIQRMTDLLSEQAARLSLFVQSYLIDIRSAGALTEAYLAQLTDEEYVKVDAFAVSHESILEFVLGARVLVARHL